MKFADLPINADIKKQLIEAAKAGRIPHAQLFLGNEGMGGLSLALAYAQFLNCEKPKDDDSCGQCKSCIKYEHLTHPDLHFVFPVVKTAKISKPFSSDFLNQWREFVLSSKFHSLDDWLSKLGAKDAQPSIYAHEAEQIVQTLSYKTFEGKYKVMIIWLPELMNISAANKILKILEEPPQNTIFLLVAHSTENILPTILSRTQIVKLKPLNRENLYKALRDEFPDIDETLISSAIAVADGNFITAKNYILKTLNTTDKDINFDLFVRFMRIAYSTNALKMIDLAEEIANLGKEQQKNFLQYSLNMLRNSLMARNSLESITGLTEGEKNFITKFSQFINHKNLEKFNFEFSKAIDDIERNAYSRIVFLDLLFSTSKLLKHK